MSLFVEKHLRRNYRLGVANAAVFGFAEAMVAPSLVLALFVAQLGGSNFLIGLLPAIYNGGWFMPQFLVAHRMQRLALKMPIFAVAAVIRVVCWGLIVSATLLLGATQPTLLLAIFFVLFAIFAFTAGFGGNAFMTIVAKVIPMQRRGSFFGWREFFATVTGLAAGYLVSLILNPNRGLAFPTNFALLLALAFVGIVVGLFLFTRVSEPSEIVEGDAISFREHMRAARRVFSENHVFRRYLLARIVLAGGDLATPFYAIYATRELGAPEQTVGLYIGITTLVALVCNPFLNWLSDHSRLGWVIRLAAGAALFMPLIALGLGLLKNDGSLALPFGMVFALYGLARTAGNISFPTYLLNIAPAGERTLYIGMTNSLLGIATFIPIIGGTLLDLFGFMPLFVITLITSACGLILALDLTRAR